MSIDSSSKLDVLKARQEYGWGWFDFHAKQRTTIFNYFLVALALVMNAFATLMRSGPYYIAVMVAVAGALAAFAFLCLEVRNRQLVRWGEEVPQDSERNFLFSSISGEASVSKILSREKPPADASQGAVEDWRQDGKYTLEGERWKYDFPVVGKISINHGTWFPAIILGAAFLFIILAIAALLISLGYVPAPPPQRS
jgi:hypothetical protein